jgi:hypothetical protein
VIFLITGIFSPVGEIPLSGEEVLLPPFRGDGGLNGQELINIPDNI